MYLHRDELKRTARAPAKLNLYLEVHERRDDGFHELATLIVPIRLADDLTLTATSSPAGRERGSIVLDVRDHRAQDAGERDIPIPIADNLVIRALELLQQRSGSRYGARVELVKRIPLAAGLGGGSSDAAAALRLANRAWGLNWSVDRLAELAAEIGSDVPFFLRPAQPFAVAEASASNDFPRCGRFISSSLSRHSASAPPTSIKLTIHSSKHPASSIQHRASSIQHPTSPPLNSRPAAGPTSARGCSTACRLPRQR